MACAFSTNLRAEISNIEVKVYQRCYALLTSMRPAANDSRITQIKAGSLTGAAACMQLFDTATLDSTNKVNTSDTIALAILRKSHERHRGFFEMKDFIFNFEPDVTSNIIDNYEPANAMTYFLHKSGQQISTAVTGTSSFKALRNSTNATTKKIYSGYEDLIFKTGDPGVTYTPSALVREGLLVGIQPDTTVNTVPSLPTIYSEFVGQNANANKGGGILGSQGYMLANVGLHFGMYPDGGINSYRRMGKNIQKDFLCREQPALRPEDVTSYVDVASSLPYRKTNSCVMCHAGMDQTGAVYRNLISIRSSYDGGLFRFFANRPSDLSSSVIFPSNPDNNYYRYPPNGKLLFRSYDGSLVDLSITSIANLGTKIATTNDFYVCMASKYYKEFTGISVNLGDAGITTFTSGETFHRNNVINMGIALKNDLSLRELLRRIFESTAFKYPDRSQ